jgi:voltage-gated potassium channel
VVTITTVGYGDVAPVTNLGRLMASVVMLLGYSIIAVPTGILGAALAEGRREAAAATATAVPPKVPLTVPTTVPTSTPGALPARSCPACGADGHASDALHCRLCGTRL